jgi:hypothetical protein
MVFMFYGIRDRINYTMELFTVCYANWKLLYCS